MTERSVLTFLSISAASISNCTMTLFSRNFCLSPATRSEKRMPQTITVSARKNAFAPASVPCMPISPSDCPSDAGNAPSPIRVEATGACMRLANCIRFCEAFELIAPPPAMIRGRFASAIARAAARKVSSFTLFGV